MQLIEEKNYLENLKHNSQIYPDDYWKMEELCKGHLRERVEIRFQENGSTIWKVFDVESVHPAV